MASDTIDYAGFVDNAMRGVVRDILRQVERTGLPGQHHFYISFRTDFAGVAMSDTLRSKYPHEITIVLQHQFWDMRVEQDLFTVSLSFNNIPEKLIVPFAALTGFADPSTKFGLQFTSEHHKAIPESAVSTSLPMVSVITAVSPPLAATDENKESAQILTLDAFRKKYY